MSNEYLRIFDFHNRFFPILVSYKSIDFDKIEEMKIRKMATKSWIKILFSFHFKMQLNVEQLMEESWSFMMVSLTDT